MKTKWQFGDIGSTCFSEHGDGKVWSVNTPDHKEVKKPGTLSVPIGETIGLYFPTIEEMEFDPALKPYAMEAATGFSVTMAKIGA